MNCEELIREQRLLIYKMFKYPKSNELTVGLEYEKNLYNSKPFSSVNSDILHNEVIVRPNEHKIPVLWGEFTIDSNTDIEELKQKLKEHQLRVRNPLTTSKIRELSWKYPLHFYTYENNKPFHIVLMQPEKGTHNWKRTIYINGKNSTEVKDYPELMRTEDWHFIKMTRSEVQQGGESLNPKKTDTIYKNLKGIYIPGFTYPKLNLVPMETIALRNLLQNYDKYPLFFKYKSFNLITLPKKDNLPNEVYVNGIEQRSIHFNDKLHEEWFKKTKDCSQEDLDFREDWRCLLDLNNNGKGEQPCKNILHKYYIGIIPEGIVQDYIKAHKKGKPAPYKEETKKPFLIAKNCIEYILKNKRQHGKES